MGCTGNNKAHDKCDKDQSEHISEQIQQSHKHCPNEINTVYANEFGNIKCHRFFLYLLSLLCRLAILCKLWINIYSLQKKT